MKVLLTIEEYRERIISVVTDVVKETVLPTAKNYFKWEIVYMLTEQAVTNDIMSIEEVNQMFIRSFLFDRNGKRFTPDMLRQIDEAEAGEVNAQSFYVEYFSECHKAYRSPDKVYPYDRMPGRSDDSKMSYLLRALQAPFTNDINTKYHLAKEIFRRLYGHDFEHDRDYVCTSING